MFALIEADGRVLWTGVSRQAGEQVAARRAERFRVSAARGVPVLPGWPEAQVVEIKSGGYKIVAGWADLRWEGHTLPPVGFYDSTWYAFPHGWVIS